LQAFTKENAVAYPSEADIDAMSQQEL